MTQAHGAGEHLAGDLVARVTVMLACLINVGLEPRTARTGSGKAFIDRRRLAEGDAAHHGQRCQGKKAIAHDQNPLTLAGRAS